MANKKRDPLKSLIHKIELDKPSPDFTNSVMKEITTQEEVAANPVLTSLLKRHGVEQSPVDFTQNVMALVEAHTFKPVDKPIISKKVWVIVATALASFVLYVGFVEQTPQSTDGMTPYFIGVGEALSAIFTHINSVSSIYLITCASFGGLLALDYLLRNLNHKHGEKRRVWL